MRRVTKERKSQKESWRRVSFRKKGARKIRFILQLRLAKEVKIKYRHFDMTKVVTNLP